MGGNLYKLYIWQLVSRIYKEAKKLNISKNLTFKMEYKQVKKVIKTQMGAETQNCLKFLAIREIRVRIALQIHLSPVRMTKIQWQLVLLRMCVGRECLLVVMGVPTGVTTAKINMEGPWEIENCLTSGPSTTFLRHAPKRPWKRVLTHAHCGSVSNSQKLETP